MKPIKLRVKVVSDMWTEAGFNLQVAQGLFWTTLGNYETMDDLYQGIGKQFGTTQWIPVGNLLKNYMENTNNK